MCFKVGVKYDVHCDTCTVTLVPSHHLYHVCALVGTTRGTVLKCLCILINN